MFKVGVNSTVRTISAVIYSINLLSYREAFALKKEKAIIYAIPASRVSGIKRIEMIR